MIQVYTSKIPDLEVDLCPVSCLDCGKIFVNTLTGHRIVCKCKICGHDKEKEELAQVVGPEASALSITRPSKEVIHDDR
jgi:hypothetical protein